MARPRKDITPQVIERLASRMGTLEDMSVYFGCSTRTLIRACQRPEIKAAIERGKAKANASLRQAQFKVALSGHPGMLIWLGKQFLGQTEKQETKQDATVNVVLQKAMQELREASKEDILKIKAIIENGSSSN